MKKIMVIVDYPGDNQLIAEDVVVYEDGSFATEMRKSGVIISGRIQEEGKPDSIAGFLRRRRIRMQEETSLSELRREHLVMKEELRKIQDEVIPFLKDLTEGRSIDYWKREVEIYRNETNLAESYVAATGLRAAEILGKKHD